jgi:hypothetical protein
MILPTTCHADPWALVRRMGDQLGKRPSTRMVYLVGTVAPDGVAVAMTGYIMNNDMTGWTKHPRRVEWSDIIKRWRHQPTKQQVQAVKKRLPTVQAAPPTRNDFDVSQLSRFD